jgi:hypothetical protein
MEKVHYRVDPGDFHRECLLAPAIVLHGGGAVNREDSLAALGHHNFDSPPKVVWLSRLLIRTPADDLGLSGRIIG